MFRKIQAPVLFLAGTLMLVGVPLQAEAQIVQASSTGFQLEIKKDLPLTPKLAYQKFVKDFNQWYDASHSYSGQAENLSLDLERACMREKLPNGGYVRHMEIVYHQPGKMFRMTGGMGPLQGLGVSGAMTYTFEPTGEQGTTVKMTYIVSGADFLKLDKLAVPVNSVLTDQLNRFQKHCSAAEKQK